MPGFIGFPEILLLGLVVLLVFGPKRLPEMGRSMGKGMREFKDSISGDKHEEHHLDALVVPADAGQPPMLGDVARARRAARGRVADACPAVSGRTRSRGSSTTSASSARASSSASSRSPPASASPTRSTAT